MLMGLLHVAIDDAVFCVDQRCYFLCCIRGMCRMYGMHPAYRFYRIYGKHLSKKVGDPDITFSQVIIIIIISLFVQQSIISDNNKPIQLQQS